MAKKITKSQGKTSVSMGGMKGIPKNPKAQKTR